MLSGRRKFTVADQAEVEPVLSGTDNFLSSLTNAGSSHSMLKGPIFVRLRAWFTAHRRQTAFVRWVRSFADLTGTAPQTVGTSMTSKGQRKTKTRSKPVWIGSKTLISPKQFAMDDISKPYSSLFG